MRDWGIGGAVNECMSEGMNDCCYVPPPLPISSFDKGRDRFALSQVRAVPSSFTDTLRVPPGGGALPHVCLGAVSSNQGRGTPSDVARAR